jgi:regulator of sigma E protease
LFTHCLVYIVLQFYLGLINLLPIPILDGGRFCALLFGAILKRKLNLTICNFATQVGGLIIIFLIVISTSNDIKSLLLSNF